MAKRNLLLVNIMLASVLSALSTAAASADTAQKTHPINCATAEGDLRAIAAEKKHAQDQQLESVVALTPAGALLGMVTGTENKRLTMLSGDYVKALDKRAAEIKSTCGVQ
ncbi:hypothetical protein [Ruegeria atlantica]|uniref:hypothetical protein n=1 Tax=Ruegeria atlantica TaxID=81569 RepID=UPI00147EBC35|nr:hypothetical protein [Ruegeria atlantica]